MASGEMSTAVTVAGLQWWASVTATQPLPVHRSSTRGAGLPLSNVLRIVNEHTRLPVDNPVDRALREGTIVGLANHTILIARDGTERPIDDSAAPMHDEAGATVGAVLVFRDVTDHKLAEAALRESEARNLAFASAAWLASAAAWR